MSQQIYKINNWNTQWMVCILETDKTKPHLTVEKINIRNDAKGSFKPSHQCDYCSFVYMAKILFIHKINSNLSHIRFYSRKTPLPIRTPTFYSPIIGSFSRCAMIIIGQFDDYPIRSFSH